MWKLETTTGVKFDDRMNVVDRNWWYATIDWEDGMICQGGNGETAVDAVIDAMKALTSKARSSFVTWAHEHEELPSFYWIWKDQVFALNGKVYEITSRNYRAISYCVTDNRFVAVSDLPFKPVPFNRRNPPIAQVSNALKSEQAMLDSMPF